MFAILAILAIIVAIATQGLTIMAGVAAATMIVVLAATLDVPAWRAAWSRVGVVD